MSAAEVFQNFLFGLIESKEQFPVDLDVAWTLLGYKRKDSAKRKLLSNFVEGVDYCRKDVKSLPIGRPSIQIMLTIDCFKQLAIISKAELGNGAREYFIECEEKLALNETHELINPVLAKVTIKQKIDHLREIRSFLDDYPDCVDIVKQIFK